MNNNLYNLKSILNSLICGNAINELKKLPDFCIDMILTSPPYDNLRDYEGYEFDFKSIAKELFRVLKKGGTMIWIVGDATINGSETGTSFEQALFFKSIGFNLHDTMIYQKNNFSNPSKTRYHQIFEYMFVLSKGKPKTFNPIIDRKNIYAGSSSFGENTTRKKDGSFVKQTKRVIKDYGMRYNIWKGNTSGQENMCKHIQHPATFPLWLAEDHIISWSNEKDVVLDPFIGSGTTAIACKKLNRNFIGIDIESKYIDLAQNRINKSNHGENYDMFSNISNKTT